MSKDWNGMPDRAVASQGLTDKRIKTALTKAGIGAYQDGALDGTFFGLMSAIRALLAEQSAAPMAVRTHTTQPGESVMGIALRECGNEKEWHHILACNPQFSDMLPHEYFPVGTVLTLPPLPRASEQADEALRAVVASMVGMLEENEWAEHAASTTGKGDPLAQRLEAAITDLHNDIAAKQAIIDEVHAWAVCAAMASPADMAQNFPRIVEITSPGYKEPQ